MRVTALDGRDVEVRRQWFPWRLRRRQVDTSDTNPFDFLDLNDGLEGIVFGLVLGLVFLLFGGIILTIAIFASEALVLLLLLVPLFAIARILWVLPWIIEVRNGDTLLGQLAPAGVEVISSSCGTDGRMRIAMCGAADGRIGIFEVPARNADAAAALGFAPLSRLPSAQVVPCAGT